jgi:hypothetical protein
LSLDGVRLMGVQRFQPLIAQRPFQVRVQSGGDRHDDGQAVHLADGAEHVVPRP